MTMINKTKAAAQDLAALSEVLQSYAMSDDFAQICVNAVLERHALMKKTLVQPVYHERKKKVFKRSPLRYRKTITEQVTEIFADFPEYAFTEEQLQKEIRRRWPDSPERSVSQTISAMKNTGFVKRVSIHPSRFRVVEGRLEKPARKENAETIENFPENI